MWVYKHVGKWRICTGYDNDQSLAEVVTGGNSDFKTIQSVLQAATEAHQTLTQFIDDLQAGAQE